MYFQLEDFLLPRFLELGDWVLTMSTSPPTWSGNIPEGIAPKKKKKREQEKHTEIHPPRDLPSSQVLTALGFPAPEEPSWSQLDEGNGLGGNGPSISQPC